jgi:hypothetical protein
MHSLLPPPRPDTGWAEGWFHTKLRIREGRMAYGQRKDAPGAHSILNYSYPWQKPDHITFYEDDWKNPLTLPHFSHKDHSTNERAHYNQWAKHDVTHYSGGHNWYMTTRFDVWFYLPDEPCQWHGTLITGGDNIIFRVRRTKLCTLHIHDVGHNWGQRWDVTPAGRLAEAPDIWLLNTQRKRTPQLYAVRVGPRWLAAPTIADLATTRLHGLQKAA